MIFRRGTRSIGILIILCMLLSGMYPSKSRVDSLLASAKTSPVGVICNATLSSPGANTTPRQTYTRETIMQYESFLVPQQTMRRYSPRLGLRNFVLHFPATSLQQAVYSHCPHQPLGTPDGFLSCAFIVTYIHNQDGEKA